MLGIELKDVKRAEHILSVLMRNELGFYVSKLELSNYLPFHLRIQSSRFSEKNTNPQVIRKSFEELGGGFIKLGQLLSLRPDLIPKEYSDEFRKLQDDVNPFDWHEAKAIINSELKKNNKSFAYINPKPIAAASICQVHEAVKHDNEKVVIKVQRPGIRETMQADIDLLKHLAAIYDKKLGKEPIDAVAVVKELDDYTKKELDFIREAKNVERFYHNFEQSKEVTIPRVHWQYTTDRVLTLEHISGIKLDDKKSKIDRRNIAKIIARTVFKQIFVDGFFHADPHPGNILVLSDSKIALLDFGIVGEIEIEMRHKLEDFFIGMISGNIDSITESMLKMGALEDEKYLDSLKLDMKSKLGMYHNTPIDKINMADVFSKVVTICRENHVSIPTNLVLLGKSLITLQGVTRELDPGFNIVEECKPFVERIIKERENPKEIAKRAFLDLHEMKNFVLGLPEKTREMLHTSKSIEGNLDKLDKDVKILTREMDKSSNRIAYGLMIVGFVLAGAFTISYGEEFYLGVPIFSFICFSISAVFLLVLFASMLTEKN